MINVPEPSAWTVKFDKHSPRTSTVSYKGEELEGLKSINIKVDASGALVLTLEVSGSRVRIVGHDGEE